MGSAKFLEIPARRALQTAERYAAWALDLLFRQRGAFGGTVSPAQAARGLPALGA